ncbi:Protein SDA1, partial [Nowakowskiella sp. JEL0078]
MLMDALETHHMVMNPALRKSMVQALMILRNRNVVSTASILPLFFTLFRCRDKALRVLLRIHIVNDIKNENLKHKNNKLNKTLQNYMYKIFSDSNEVAAQKSLEVMIELYQKNIWNDTKTVNVIADACFSKTPKVMTTALEFFLGGDNKKEEEEEEDAPDIQAIQHNLNINKKKKSKKVAYQKALATIKKKTRKSNKPSPLNFSALHLMHDPQGFAERLFSRLRNSASSSTTRFPLRLQMMNLISRLMATHKLILLPFYEFLLPYLQPHQRDVVHILAFAAQATHELSPPDEIAKVVECIADRFVWSNCATEVVVAGLNGIREVCVRSPLAMSQTLLQSLIDDYKNHKQKGAMNAARALLGVYREVNPEILKKKDRGKNASMSMKTFVAPKYADFTVSSGVDGAELLSLDKISVERENDQENIEREEGWEGWEEVSNSDDELEGDENDEVDEDDVIEDIEDEDVNDDFEEISDDEVNEGGEDEISDEVVNVDVNERLNIKDSETTSTKIETKTLRIDMERIFTDEDFKKIKALKLKHDYELLAGLSVKDRKKRMEQIAEEEFENNAEDDEEVMSDEDKSEFINPQSLLSGIKRKREEEEKSEDPKQKYGSKRGKTERSSITNRVKSKKSKAVMMMVHKREVKGKSRRSLKDKS